jgi:hypothetical protein
MLKVKDRFKFTNDFGEPIVPTEYKLALLKFNDPLYLNFKLLINDTSRGFLGGITKVLDKPNTDPESIVNDDPDFPVDSAMAYLIRIGEKARAILLQQFMLGFVNIIRNHEYLIQTAEGVDDFLSAKKWETFIDGQDHPITIKFAETVDSKVTSVLCLASAVTYDISRNCYVLPVNLRAMDFGILVYNADYFNSELYEYDDSDDIERQMFPTIKKVNQIGIFTNNVNNYNDPPKFIHSLIEFSGAIDINKTGTEYFSNAFSNIEIQATSQTNLVINCWNYCKSSSFKNMFGNINIEQMLAIMAELNKLDTIEQITMELTNHVGYLNFGTANGSIGGIVGNTANWGQKFVNSMLDYSMDTLNNLKNRAGKYATGLKSMLSTSLGVIQDYTNPNLAANLLGRFTNGAIKILDDAAYSRYIKEVHKFNNFMRLNTGLNDVLRFEDQVLNNLRLLVDPKNNQTGVSLMNQPRMGTGNKGQIYIPEEKHAVDSGLKYEKLGNTYFDTMADAQRLNEPVLNEKMRSGKNGIINPVLSPATRKGF